MTGAPLDPAGGDPAGGPPPTRWAQAVGPDAGPDYARRIAEATELARASGDDPDGEARFLHDLLAPEARVLDAGCGTGRVAIALAALGHPVVGVDADLSMLRVAAEDAPRIPFWLADLTDLDLPQGVVGAGFDAVVLAGNVVPYLAPGTLDSAMAQVASVTRPGGVVIAGFGVSPAQLPPDLPVTPVGAYDAAASAAGLTPVERFAGWDRAPWREDAPYVVAIHRRPPRPAAPPVRGWRGLLRRGR